LPKGADRAHAVQDLSLSLDAGEIVCIVGESGSGKSMAANAMMGLLPDGVRVTGGRIIYGGRDLLALPERARQDLRGKDLAMIFQEPMTALNPVYNCGEQIAEVVRRHEGLDRRSARLRAVEMLDAVGIPDPGQRANDYPHQLSGGMRQRVMIAMALACKPALLIADEPTTALDVTVQAQVFDLLKQLQRATHTAIVLITHDMGTVAEMAQGVVVMYAGRVAETGTTAALLERPAHPYTQGLIRAVPQVRSGEAAAEAPPPLVEIPGMVPDLSQRPVGCAFAPRCPARFAPCDQPPPLLPADPQGGAGHGARCWLLDDSPPTSPVSPPNPR
ncbi:MAG: ABC transporter ATP-binding protein, partial [Candidatus Competibacterales bacterium]